MFIEVRDINSHDDILINLDLVTKIEHKRSTTVIFTDIHKNEICALYTVELANILERLKHLGL